jgi:hypothetical protein
MSLLTMIQDAMALCGLASPSSAYGSSDATVSQFVALAQVEGDELSRFADWRALKVSATFTGDGESTLWDLPTDFDRFMNGAIFWSEESSGNKLFGPIPDDDLVALKAMETEPPEPVWRLFGDQIEIWPALDDGEVVNTEYRSAYWILDNDGSTRKARWTADSDRAVISERLMTLGLVWRWKQTKGLEYSEAFRTYQIERTRQASNDGGKGVITLRDTFSGDVRRMGRLAAFRVIT